MDFEVTYTEEQQRIPARGARLARGERAAGHQRAPTLARGQLPRAIWSCARSAASSATKGWLYPARARRSTAAAGSTSTTAIILEEEVDRFDLSLPPYYDSGGRLGAATILVWGTEEQKQAFLPPIYRGEVRTWQLLTEPGAGSDLAGVTMRGRSATATST